MSGTGRATIGYPSDLLNRTSTGISKIPTVIDRAWELVATTFKIKQLKAVF
jgi:hypothetical protein